MKHIDLNCDMGEGMGNEALLMPYISSANIACGYHAGSVDEIKTVMALCIKYGVAIGAHPSFNDRNNFGRTEMYLSASELYQLVTEQIQLMKETAAAMGTVLHHVKPHGALYNMAARNENIAQVIADAIKAVDDSLIVYGLSGSVMIDKAQQAGLRTAQEVFADRTYQPDGSLTPRTQPNALIKNETAAIQQVQQMIEQKNVLTTTGNLISIQADTVCIHGDGQHAVSFVQRLYEYLIREGITIQTIKY
ncbi:MAG: LamB/YcsF family protein [Bacteroidetes bacterium]|nr:LamB/YcsF family protein [Bacteroidota bacterium]